jgi:hypothetical protein
MGNEIMEDEIGGPCSTNGRDKKLVQNFGRKNLKEIKQSEDLSVDGMIILK